MNIVLNLNIRTFNPSLRQAANRYEPLLILNRTKTYEVLSLKLKTYQIILLLFTVVFNNHSFSQDDMIVYQPSDFFVSSSLMGSNSIFITDSIEEKYELIDQFFVSGPSNPMTKESDYYLAHRKYQFDNGQIISLDIISDSIFLFSEYVKSFDQKKDSIISTGRLSKKVLRTQETILLDSHQNDSLAIDTIYTFVSDGFWSKNINHRLFEVGEYVDGEKEGEWHTIIAKYSDRKIPPIIRTTKYNSDSIIKINQIDKSKDLNFLKENLMGKWYNEGMDWENMRKRLDDDTCNDFYVKNRNDAYYTGRLRGFYNHFSLLNKGVMEYIVGTACGTGISLETSKWNLNKNGQLVLDDKKWNIEYFTENRLIISRHFGS